VGVRKKGDRMKKLLFVIFIFLSLNPLYAMADEKADLAEKIITLTKMNKILEQTKLQVLQMQAQMIDRFDIPEDKKDDALAFQRKLIEKTFEIMSFDTMHNEYVKLFTDVYTIEELKGMISFYESPIGQSMIEKQPLIIKKVMELSQERMRILIPELKKMIEEFENNLKKE
jgi:hypothetical protein